MAITPIDYLYASPSVSHAAIPVLTAHLAHPSPDLCVPLEASRGFQKTYGSSLLCAMGNGLSPCVSVPAGADAPAAARLVYWGGRTRALPVTDDEEEGEGNGGVSCTAADVTAELLPGDHVVCPADSFFVGLPVPVASPGERLLPGRTYFVLPRRLLSSPSPGGNGNGKAAVLTAATLASLSAAPGGRKTVQLAGPGQCPFEYVKGGEDGAAALIRVLPQFIEKVITCDGANGDGDAAGRRGSGKAAASATELCSTPELKRHYAQLVGAKGRTWSPRLETISERSKRRIFPSPARLLLSSQ
ncbi:uncharacterized protein LOC123440971 [Hordeum vulgare subsp. vulgare]|nr:uncharacterized protein LOC123440971 [Hordeum vulgare subsp. vulgare]